LHSDRNIGEPQQVWRVIEATSPQGVKNTEPEPSVVIFTKAYYSIQGIESSDPRPLLMPNATDKRRADIFGLYAANSGTYQLREGEITLRRIVAKDPAIMAPGTFLINAIRFDGRDTFWMSGAANQNGPIARSTAWKLTRLE